MLNKDSKLSAEGQLRVARAFGHMFQSICIPGHYIYFYANFSEFIRVMKSYYEVKKLEEIQDLYDNEGELFLNEQTFLFITSKKLVARPSKMPYSEPYPQELMARGENLGFKY